MNISISKSALKLLNAIYKHQPVDTWSESLYHVLENNGLITLACNEDGSPQYADPHITDLGIAYLENNKQIGSSVRRSWAQLIISNILSFLAGLLCAYLIFHYGWN